MKEPTIEFRDVDQSRWDDLVRLFVDVPDTAEKIAVQRQEMRTAEARAGRLVAAELPQP